MPYLIIHGPQGRRVHELGKNSLLGRDPACEVPLEDGQASRRHAEIREENGSYVLSDLGTTNGTCIGGERIQSGVVLEDGDELSIGRTTLIFTRRLHSNLERDALKPGQAVGTSTDATQPQPTLKGSGTVPRSGVRVPRGTVVIPLERFGLRTQPKGESPTISSGPDDRSLKLQVLYRLLREAAQSSTEDDLFESATRLLILALDPARLRVAFDAAKAGKAGNECAVHVWSPPGAAQQEGSLPSACRQLLSHARERGVAVLSPDVELDARIDEAAKRGVSKSRVIARKELEASRDRERITMLIAPLMDGRTALGYLIADRSYQLERGEPFQSAHLEFLAAAAYPLATLLGNLRRRENVVEENTRLRRSLEDRYRMVGESPKMKDVYTFLERVAPTDSPVLVLGESGTGKELVARSLHAMSPRSRGPFEAVNCAALPENLVESELFGHAKGAFTGATRDRAGIFETASGGTLFLDEIGELPMTIQAKLLRVLEDHRLSRVGETRLRDIDCRILCATNRDLAVEVEGGRFRQDLYYRLRVLEVCLPPLRERLEDLPLLCRHLLAPFGDFNLQPEVVEFLARYSWPGNIRELRNTLERMAVMTRPTGGARGGRVQLRPQDVPLDIRGAVQGGAAAPAPGTVASAATPGAVQDAPASAPTGFVVPGPEYPPLEELQVSYARWVLDQCKGNKSQAAKTLGIQRSTLYSWTEWKKKK